MTFYILAGAYRPKGAHSLRVVARPLPFPPLYVRDLRYYPAEPIHPVGVHRSCLASSAQPRPPFKSEQKKFKFRSSWLNQPGYLYLLH